MKTIAVIVNARQDSSQGERAQGLFAPLMQQFNIKYYYRQRNRAKALTDFIANIITARPDLVYLVDTATPGAFACVFCRIFANRRFIVDTGDLNYQLAKSRGVVGRLGLAAIFLGEYLATHLAAAIVVRGTYHKLMLEKSTNKKIQLIRDATWTGKSADTPVTNPPDAPDLRDKLGLGNNFIVGMVGTLSYNPRYQLCYGWDIIEAMAFIDPQTAITAIIIGDGEGLAILKNRAAKLGVADRVRFLGRVKYDELPEYLNLFDVAISTQTNNPVGMVRTTGKLVDYMASGCFVLCSDVGEAKILLPEIMRIPYVGMKDEEYPRKLAARLMFLYENRSLIAEGGQRNRAIAQEQLDYEQASKSVRNLVSEQLLGHGQGRQP